jgi:hypothetical protein
LVNIKQEAVGINTNGSCTHLLRLVIRIFVCSFAHAATNAENVTWEWFQLKMEEQMHSAKTNLQLQNVNNTSDADKPVSTATTNGSGFKSR